MNSNKLIPELRFPKFKYEWKLKKFDFNFLQTNTFSRSEMNNNKGSVKNIHYGDILIKYNNILDDTSLIPFINEDINLNRFREESYLKNGDIIIADTAEDFSAGKAIEVQNIDCKVLSGQHTFLCRSEMKYAPKYLGYYLNSPSYRKYLIKFLTGTKVYSINKKNMKNTFIIYPKSLEEQHRIASFLTSADEL
uniref:restriction endonuclease subunit S n=1 Tax=uncultured Brachyspira sp. TaxID=221953 RepID=UPI0025FE46B9